MQSLLTTYEHLYDAYIIRSLVDKMGVHIAKDLLAFCCQYSGRNLEKHRSMISLAKNGKGVQFLNISTICQYAESKYGSHPRSKEFAKDAFEHVKTYLKPQDVVSSESRGSKQQADVTPHIQSLSFSINYTLYIISNLPQCSEIIRLYNVLATGDPHRRLMEDRNLQVISHQVRLYFAMTYLLDASIKDILGKEAAEKIKEQVEMVQYACEGVPC